MCLIYLSILKKIIIVVLSIPVTESQFGLFQVCNRVSVLNDGCDVVFSTACNGGCSVNLFL